MSAPRLSRATIRSMYERRRPTLANRVWRSVCSVFVRWIVQSDERWLEHCRNGGIMDTRSMAPSRRHLQAMRVRARLLEIER